jgi:hypothetical protein
VTIQGSFVGDAPYFAVRLRSSHVQGLAWLLADTGASRTVLMDREVRQLGLSVAALQPAPGAIVGVGGSVQSWVLPAVDVVLSGDAGDVVLRRDLWVVQHDLQHLSPQEVSRILQIPSVLGRDLMNHFRFTCDYQSQLVELHRP